MHPASREPDEIYDSAYAFNEHFCLIGVDTLRIYNNYSCEMFLDNAHILILPNKIS